MKEYVIHLIPRSNFEIELHSDTMFGAICWGIRMLFGEKKLLSILEEFTKNDPPFLLSSAFPWREFLGKRIYYLPKPILPPLSASEIKSLINKSISNLQPYNTEKMYIMEITSKYKNFKNLKWIPISRLKNTLKQISEHLLFIDYLDGYIKEIKFAEVGIVQKNRLDRLTESTSGSGEVFFTSTIVYKQNYGLYFLLKTKNIDEYLRPVLMFLQDSGIGPNSKTGKNWFNVEIEEKKLFDSYEGNAFMTLSRFVCSDNINIEKSFYKVTVVRSKVESRLEFAGEDVWKNTVTYLNTGSIISPQEKKTYYGKIIPVKEIAGKTIYQYGYAYPLWLNIGGNNGL